MMSNLNKEQNVSLLGRWCSLKVSTTTTIRSFNTVYMLIAIMWWKVESGSVVAWGPRGSDSKWPPLLSM